MGPIVYPFNPPRVPFSALFLQARSSFPFFPWPLPPEAMFRFSLNATQVLWRGKNEFFSVPALVTALGAG